MAESGWLTVTPLSGPTGQTSVTLSASKCTQKSARKAFVVFKAGNVTRKVIVGQNGSSYAQGLTPPSISATTDGKLVVTFRKPVGSQNPEDTVYYYYVGTAQTSGDYRQGAVLDEATKVVEKTGNNDEVFYVRAWAVAGDEYPIGDTGQKAFSLKKKLSPPLNLRVVSSNTHSITFGWDHNPANTTLLGGLTPGYHILTGTTEDSALDDEELGGYKQTQSTAYTIDNIASNVNRIWVAVQAFYSGWGDSEYVTGSGDTAPKPYISITTTAPNNTIAFGNSAVITFQKTNWVNGLNYAIDFPKRSTVFEVSPDFGESPTANIQFNNNGTAQVTVTNRNNFGDTIDVTISTTTTGQTPSDIQRESLTIHFSGKGGAPSGAQIYVYWDKGNSESVEIPNNGYIELPKKTQHTVNLRFRILADEAKIYYTPSTFSNITNNTNITGGEVNLDPAELNGDDITGYYFITTIYYSGTDVVEAPLYVQAKKGTSDVKTHTINVKLIPDKTTSVNKTDIGFPGTGYFTCDEQMQQSVTVTSNQSWRLKCVAYSSMWNGLEVYRTAVAPGNNITSTLSSGGTVSFESSDDIWFKTGDGNNSEKGPCVFTIEPNSGNNIQINVTQGVNWTGADGQPIPFAYITTEGYEDEESVGVGDVKKYIGEGAGTYYINVSGNTYFELYISDKNGNKFGNGSGDAPLTDMFVSFSADSKVYESGVISDYSGNSYRGIPFYVPAFNGNPGDNRTNIIKLRYARRKDNGNNCELEWVDSGSGEEANRVGKLYITQEKRETYLYVGIYDSPYPTESQIRTFDKNTATSNMEESTPKYFVGQYNEIMPNTGLTIVVISSSGFGVYANQNIENTAISNFSDSMSFGDTVQDGSTTIYSASTDTQGFGFRLNMLSSQTYTYQIKNSDNLTFNLTLQKQTSNVPGQNVWRVTLKSFTWDAPETDQGTVDGRIQIYRGYFVGECAVAAYVEIDGLGGEVITSGTFTTYEASVVSSSSAEGGGGASSVYQKDIVIDFDNIPGDFGCSGNACSAIRIRLGKGNTESDAITAARNGTLVYNDTIESIQTKINTSIDMNWA